MSKAAIIVSGNCEAHEATKVASAGPPNLPSHPLLLAEKISASSCLILEIDIDLVSGFIGCNRYFLPLDSFVTTICIMMIVLLDDHDLPQMTIE